MLKKIIAVRNVGRFINSAYSGLPSCARTTLVLGANGFGKTTLCAILRSFAANDPAIVIGRTRVGSNAVPDIELLLEGGNAIFRKGAWSVYAPEFIVFDGVFIAENVHSGDVVDLEQKRNLYRVIIGKEGVGLASEEERLAAESRAKSGEINTAEKAIQTHVPAGAKLAEFIRLPVDADIDSKITAQAKTIEAVRAAEQLKSRAGPTSPGFPALPPDLEVLLASTLEGIAAAPVDSVLGPIFFFVRRICSDAHPHNVHGSILWPSRHSCHLDRNRILTAVRFRFFVYGLHV